MLQGPGENAGIIDIQDGQAIVMKIESHNHPSAAEPPCRLGYGDRWDTPGHFHHGGNAGCRSELPSIREVNRSSSKEVLAGAVAGMADYGVPSDFP